MRAFSPEKRSHHQELAHYKYIANALNNKPSLSFSLLTRFPNFLYTSKAHSRQYPACGIIAVAREAQLPSGKKNVVAAAHMDSTTGSGLQKPPEAIKQMLSHNLSLSDLENRSPTLEMCGWNEMLLQCQPNDIRCIFFSPEKNNHHSTFHSFLDAVALHYAFKEEFGKKLDIRSRSNDGIFGKKLQEPKEADFKEYIYAHFPHLASVIHSSSTGATFNTLSHPLDIARFINTLTSDSSTEPSQKTNGSGKSFVKALERSRASSKESAALI